MTRWLASTLVAGDLHLAEGSLACGSPRTLEQSSLGVIANKVVYGAQGNSGLWPGSCCDRTARTSRGRQTEHRVIPASSLVPAVSATGREKKINREDEEEDKE